MINIIPFIVFTIIFVLNKRYVGRFFCLSNFIHLLYMLSTFCFFALIMNGGKAFYNIEALLLLVLSNVFLVWPLAKVEKKVNKEVVDFSFLKVQNLKYFCVFLISISFVSIVFFGVNLRYFFTVDIVALRASHGALYQGGTLISKIACMGAYLSPVCLFLYYFNLAKKQLPRYFTVLLLVSSFSFIIYGLNVAGRDGIVIWFLLFIGLFFLFHCFLGEEERKNNNRVLLYGGLVALPLLILISSARFSSSDLGTFWSMLNYLGQCLGNLSKNIDAYMNTGEPPMDASGTFELLYAARDVFFGSDHIRHERFGRGYAEINWLLDQGFTPYSFCYYIGSIFPLVVSLPGYLVFILVVFIVINRNIVVKEGMILTANFLVAFSWYTIIIIGVFYFYYATYIGNFFLLIVLFIPLILKNK